MRARVVACRHARKHGDEARLPDGANHLISHAVLCGISIAVWPPGPARAGIVMHAKGSRPVIPLYLPVPPVMICVPQFISGCDLSTSRVSNVEKILSPSVSANTQAPSMYFLSPDATLSAAQMCRHLVEHLYSFHVLRSPNGFQVGRSAEARDVNIHDRSKDKM